MSTLVQNVLSEYFRVKYHTDAADESLHVGEMPELGSDTSSDDTHTCPGVITPTSAHTLRSPTERGAVPPTVYSLSTLALRAMLSVAEELRAHGVPARRNAATAPKGRRSTLCPCVICQSAKITYA